jgi:uridine kinase
VVIFVAGLSGSGKSVAARDSQVPTVLSLDSYFHDDREELPKWFGRTDWETIESFNIGAALDAVLALATGGQVAVPVYDHYKNRAVRHIGLTANGPFVVEGVYAPNVFAQAEKAGLVAKLLLLDVPARTAFAARIRRDVGERHMSMRWAVTRSIRLLLRHGSYRRAAIQLGAEAHDRSAAPRRIAELAHFRSSHTSEPIVE